MPNNKPIGVAFSDPELVAGTTITGATITGTNLNAVTVGSTGGTAGFFGVTPTTQPAALSTNALPTLTTANISGLTTAEVSALNSTLLNVNSVITDLKALGLIG
jgi:hypothetical protein